MTRQSIIDSLGQSIDTNLRERIINSFLGSGNSFDDKEVSDKLEYIFRLNNDTKNNPVNNIYFLSNIVGIYKLLNKVVKLLDQDDKNLFYIEKRKIIRFLIYNNFLISFNFDQITDRKDQVQISLLLNFKVLNQSWQIHEFSTKETINLLRFKGYDINMKDIYRLNQVNKSKEVTKKENIVQIGKHEYTVSSRKICCTKKKSLDKSNFTKNLVLIYWFNLAIESTGFFELSF